MPRKPDRFERMVNQNFGVIVSTRPENARLGQYMYREDAVKLLRRQHRAYVRMIQAHNRYIQSFPDRDIQLAWKDGNKYACTELLNQFKEYKC